MRPENPFENACGHPVAIDWHDCRWQPRIEVCRKRGDEFQIFFNFKLRPLQKCAKIVGQASSLPGFLEKQPASSRQDACSTMFFRGLKLLKNGSNGRQSALTAKNSKRDEPADIGCYGKNFSRNHFIFKTMKTKLSSRRYRAFTLIELLTVIAIIAILAAMLLPVLAAAKRHALKVKAQLQCNDIVTAIQAYDSAYGRFPVSQAAQGAANPDFTYGGTLHDAGGVLSTPIGTTPVGSGNPPILTNAEVIAILMDITNYPGTTESTANTNHEKNPQMTKFLKATMVSDNTLPGVGTDLVYRDPWGNPYIITMDLNYDDMCKDALYSISKVSQQSGSTGYNGLIDPTDSTGADNNFEYRGKVMVWSAGPDGKIDANTPATQGYNKDNILSWK